VRAAAAHGSPEYRPRRPEELLLHRVVLDHWATFVARASARGGHLPRFVDRELRKFVECGVLALGLVRVRCAACGHDRAVPFSCKGRGFCPSCGGRRMAEIAARLVDDVLPRVPIRQWVLSLPRPLRYRIAYDARLCSAVLAVYVRAVFGWLRRRARRAGVRDGQPGAVTLVQRFGSAVNLNLHYHTLVLDGVYRERDGAATFWPLPPPTQRDVEKVCAAIARRVHRLLVRRGIESDAPDPLAENEPLLASISAASIQSLIATGDRAGAPVARVGDQVEVDETPSRRGPLCAEVRGFSLQAAVAVPANDRSRLERLVRYVARPPIAAERLSLLGDGRLAYELKKKWSDGTTHVMFRPEELIEKLVALVPAPHKNLIRYHGVLRPAARAGGGAGQAAHGAGAARLRCGLPATGPGGAASPRPLPVVGRIAPPRVRDRCARVPVVRGPHADPGHADRGDVHRLLPARHRRLFASPALRARPLPAARTRTRPRLRVAALRRSAGGGRRPFSTTVRRAASPPYAPHANRPGRQRLIYLCSVNFSGRHR
jgi:hypothetical protein